MSVKFLPTPEQAEISGHFVSAILFDDMDYVIPVEAPAGTGKTQLTAQFMKDLQKHAPEKKIGYFIFNSFMKDEISKRAFAMDIHNTSFFTYHSFLLQHALTNPKIKDHFHEANGEPRIDFTKQGYSKEEGRKSSEFVLKGKKSDLMSDFLFTAFNQWLNSDESLMEFSMNLINKIYSKEEISEDEVVEPLPEPYQRTKILLDEFESILAHARPDILARISKPMSGDLPLDKVGVLFLAQGMTHLIKTNKLSHSAYYKEVYNIAQKENIDLFEEFDAIIVDEAQDMDRVFKRLIELSNKPTMVIGDRSQSIYAWRGAVNMMEEVGKKNKVHSLSYSFRYYNDVAQLSNLLLLEKEEAPAVLVTGKYTDKIKSIQEDLATPQQMAEKVMNTIKWRLDKCEQFEGLPAHEMKVTALKKYLAEDKVAFISRNNSTLINALFKAMPYIRSFDKAEHIQISLTDSVGEDFVKLKKCDFGYKTNKRIEQLTGVPYNQFKSGKTLEEMLTISDVRSAIFDDNKINFLLDSENFSHFSYLLEQLSLRSADTVLKDEDLTRFDLAKLKECDFGELTNKRIANTAGVPYEQFKANKTLKQMLRDSNVKSALFDNSKLNFLLDSKNFRCMNYIIGEILPDEGLYAVDNGEVDANLDFTKINNCDFGEKTNRRIEEITGVPYEEFKEARTFTNMLADSGVRMALGEDNRLKFLLTDEGLKNFKDLSEKLLYRKVNSLSKSDKNANLIFTTVHGAKGKEYKHTYLAEDIFKMNNDGEITQEEYNIAYVALTRTKGMLYFMETPDGQPHPLNKFFLEKREELSEILKADYTYTFPYGTDMSISRRDISNDEVLYTHTFKDKHGRTDLFMIDEPITMGMIGYMGEETTSGIKFRDKNRKEKILGFDGSEREINHKDNVTYYYYGVGKTRDADILSKKKVMNTHKRKALSPKMER